MTEIMERSHGIDTAPTLTSEQEKELRDSLEALFSWRGTPGKRGGEPEPVRAVGFEAFRVILNQRALSQQDGRNPLSEGQRRHAEGVVAGLEDGGRVTIFDGLGLETIDAETAPRIIVGHTGSLALELMTTVDGKPRPRVAGFDSVTLHEAA